MLAMMFGSETTVATDTVDMYNSCFTHPKYCSAYFVLCQAGRNHTTLNPDDGTSTFWDFSWDEMASLDAPALISMVTETTGVDGIAWVGHSEGTIQIFAAASESNPTEEQAAAMSKIKIFAALAPVAYVSDMASKVLVKLLNTPLLSDMYDRGKCRKCTLENSSTNSTFQVSTRFCLMGRWMSSPLSSARSTTWAATCS